MHHLSQQQQQSQQQLASLQRQRNNRSVNCNIQIGSNITKQIKTDQHSEHNKNLGFAGTSQASLNCAQHSQIVQHQQQQQQAQQQMQQQQALQQRFNSGPMGPGAGISIFLNNYLSLF